MESSSSKSRLYYLDWLRGLAAVIMLQGHVFHSFLKNELREGGAYVFSQFLGGMPPAIFLFLTGITLAFLMDSSERKGLPAGRRVWTAVRRAGYLLGVAFLFRVQLWLFSLPDSSWTDMLKVDILNCMGLGILLLSLMAVFRTAERVRFCAILGLAIAAASPVVSQLDLSAIPAPVRAYIVPDFNYFSFFPWAAYLVFGVSAGSLIRLLKREHLERAMQWSALLGFGLVVGAYYFSTLPYSLYAKSDFWLNSPAQILIKQGVILLALPTAFLWTEYGARPGWSWVRQFGTTSLLVYWVHIELVYGHTLWFCKDSLTIPQTAAAAVLVILLMLLVSTIKTHPERWKEFLASLGWKFNPMPDS